MLSKAEILYLQDQKQISQSYESKMLDQKEDKGFAK
jgi:hypothetical protein